VQFKPSDFIAWAGVILGGLIAMKKPKKLIGWFLIVASTGYLLLAIFTSDSEKTDSHNQIATTSGSNNTVIQAAPNSTVNLGISETEMRELLRNKSIAANREFSDKYPCGYVIFGAVNGKIIYEPNFSTLKIPNSDLENAKLTINPNHTASILFPKLEAYETDGTLSGGYYGVNFAFPLVPNQASPTGAGFISKNYQTQIALYCEMIDLEKGIYLLGFK
jgi:hypothetical protein